MGQGWIADYPDGDNFFQLLYGPNCGPSNDGCFESKAFDKLYDACACRRGRNATLIYRDVAAWPSTRLEPS